MPLILFEDEHLLVIDKPAGWNTHAPSPFAGEGVFDWLRHRQPRWASLAIIHRLDRETSGVLVFGKSSLANKSLTAQFAERTVAKKYLLLTDRTPKQREFTARSTIVRAGERYISRPVHSGGDLAETRFRAVHSDGGRTLVEAEPLTGRTHQIRVHAAEHGIPVLGDTLYGGTSAARVFLHAASISLRHPVTGGAVSFATPLASPAAAGESAWPEHNARSFIEAADTDAFRIVHGASDGRPGWFVDKLGDFLLSQSDGPLDGAHRAFLVELVSLHGARAAYHKVLNRNIRGKGGPDASPHLVLGDAAPERFAVRENGLNFELSFHEGYSVGLFLDQRDNRRRFLCNHVAAGFPILAQGLAGAKVLNTFAYTCAFSVSAARAGARSTSLDLSKKYLEWGRRNFSLNGLEPAAHDFIYGDAFDWMRRLAKKARAFDVIVLDPPTFSQSKEGGAWQAERDYGRLMGAAIPLLKPGGVMLASTNATRLEPEKFLGTIADAVRAGGRRILQQHFVPQPPDFPVTRAEPGYLKTVWLRLEAARPARS
jgi:23S rRNA (cytosine1962-C5)-methyltransferase